MGEAITKGVNGRPSKYTEELVTKLESILQVGGTIDEACSYAGISRETYYRWLEDNEGFLTKMEAAKYYSDIIAKNVVVDTIVKGKNVENAKWWLEKRQFSKDKTMGVRTDGRTIEVVFKDFE